MAPGVYPWGSIGQVSGSSLSRLRYIGNSFEVKETKSFAEDFIERLKFVGKASEEEIDKIASKVLNKR